MDPAKRGQPLDEDDEFEEFDVDDWGPEQADPANAALWDRAWDGEEGGGGGGAATGTEPSDAVGQHLRAQAERLARPQGAAPSAQQQQQQLQQQQQQQQQGAVRR